MNLPTEVFGNVAVIHAPEELGAEQVGPFQSFLGAMAQSSIVLDLDSNELLDSVGLTALVDEQERLRLIHGDLKIATSNAINLKILELTRLDQQFEVFESVVDAVKSFR